MFNLGGMEILVILVVALLVLGPDKLPTFMRTIGKALGELRRTTSEFTNAIHIDMATGRDTPPDSAQKRETPSSLTTQPDDTANEAVASVDSCPKDPETRCKTPLLPSIKRKRTLPRAARLSRRYAPKNGNSERL